MTVILIRRERKVRGTHRETRKHRGKVGICKPSREAPGEVEPVDVLILNFQLQNCEAITVCV